MTKTPKTRTVSLRREALRQLTTVDLAAVVGGTTKPAATVRSGC